jgi:nucleotide-binding universal stress UspA family protein
MAWSHRFSPTRRGSAGRATAPDSHALPIDRTSWGHGAERAGRVPGLAQGFWCQDDWVVMGLSSRAHLETVACDERGSQVEGRGEPRRFPRFRTVLCPVDFSEQSLTALSTAAALAQDPASRLVVCHVAGHGSKPQSFDRLQHFVHGALPSTVMHGDRITIDVRGGRPAPAILDAVIDVRADLVVTSTRGRTGLSKALLGSVASALLCKSSVPVMVVPPTGTEIWSLTSLGSTPHVGRVVAATDLTDASSRMLAWAGRVSCASEEPLFVMHVVPEGTNDGPVRARLEACVRRLQTSHGARAILRHGGVVEALAQLSGGEADVGLVVMGRNGKAPGAFAYELLRQGRSVVAMVP